MTPVDVWRWPHFSYPEVACRRCKVVHGIVHPEVLDLAEAIREKVNHPLHVNSGSRCLEHEAAIYAKMQKPCPKHSPHVAVETEDYPLVSFALDLSSSLVSGYALAEHAMRIMPSAGVGVKLYGGSFCHIDVAHLSGLPWWRHGRRW